MACRRCGAQIPRDANFCPLCGTATPSEGPPPGDVATESDVPAAIPAVVATEHAVSVAEDGGVRGWLNRRRSEHEQHKLEDEQYRAAVARLRGGDDSAETLAEIHRLSDPRHTPIARAALIAFSDTLLADDRVTLDEEARWHRVSDALGVQTADLANTEFTDTMTRLAIARINDGRLTVMPPGTARLMVKPGEIVHIETAASLMKEVVDREFRGGSRGVSIPIVKGVRYRTGSFRGKSVVVGSHLEAADTGILSVSSRRVVFMGNRKTIDTPYAKLAGLDVYTDGLRVHSSSRQTASLFKIPKAAEIVAATLQAAVQASAG